MAPTSPGNCSSRRRIARDALRSHADSGCASGDAAPPPGDAPAGIPGDTGTPAPGLMWFAPWGR